MSEVRLFPRLRTQIEARLARPEQAALPVVLANVSPGGVMVRTDLVTKKTLLAGSDPLAQLVEAHFSCRLPAEPQPFACRCRLVYVRRLAQNEFELGFRFIQVSQVHADMLERYVFGECSMPKTRHRAQS